MKSGFIGLGRMGQALVRHFLESQVSVVAYNRTGSKTEEFFEEYKERIGKGEKLAEFIPVFDYRDFVSELERPRIIFIMVEHGHAVDEVIDNLIISGCGKDDIVTDCGNSYYKDSIMRYKRLKENGIKFLDAGVSGGIEGARDGACIMVGGERQVFDQVKPYFEELTGEKGDVTYFGESGAGHYVKMVHNGVEYGMMQAISEGFEILHKSLYKPDLHKVALNWRKGSVIRGWLMELLERALSKDQNLSQIEGVIGGGSTGEWTVEAAKELLIEVPVIEKSVEMRKKSKEKPTFAGKVAAALRREFGGHPV